MTDKCPCGLSRVVHSDEGTSYFEPISTWHPAEDKAVSLLRSFREAQEHLERARFDSETDFDECRAVEHMESLEIQVDEFLKDTATTWHPTEHKVKEQMYLGEISDQQEIIRKLLDVIREVYSLNGEDPEINRLCNSVLEQFSG